MRRMKILHLAASCVVLAAAPAAAQQPAIIQDVSACRAIVDGVARLACYDRNIERLTGLVAAREVVIVDREAVRKTRRTLFGLSLPRLPLLGDREDSGVNAGADDLDEITANIKTVAEVSDGRYQVTLDDGATWRTSEAARIAFKAGKPVTIRKAALGSYFLRSGSNRGVRAMRIN